MIIDYVSNNQKNFLKYALRICGCMDKAKEYVSMLNIIWLDGLHNYDKPLKTYLMNNYSTGILSNIDSNNYKFNKKFERDFEWEINIDSLNYKFNKKLERDFEWERMSMSHELEHGEYFQTMYENELRFEGYTDEQITKLSRIKSFIRQCNPTEQNLYKMYFIDNLSLRKIGKKCNIPHSSVAIQLNKLKNKLRKCTTTPQNPIF